MKPLVSAPPALPRAQRGAALAVGLILLLVLTLLAVTGFNTATTELVMAGNEQYRRNAAQAATTGIEQAIARVDRVSTVRGGPAQELAGELDGPANDTFVARTRFAGEERNLPQSSADKFVGLHFTIESTGASRRQATDTQVQGVMVVAPVAPGGADTFGQIGAGLGP
jgi:type IV pilus assembly protein PilX